MVDKELRKLVRQGYALGLTPMQGGFISNDKTRCCALTAAYIADTGSDPKTLQDGDMLRTLTKWCREKGIADAFREGFLNGFDADLRYLGPYQLYDFPPSERERGKMLGVKVLREFVKLSK